MNSPWVQITPARLRATGGLPAEDLLVRIEALLSSGPPLGPLSVR